MLTTIINKLLKSRVINNNQGQSMVEFAVAAPVLLLLMLSIIYISDLYIYKQKTIIAARYGAWRLARSEDPNTSAVKTDICNFFFPGENARLTWTPNPPTSTFSYSTSIPPALETILNNLSSLKDSITDKANEIFTGQAGSSTYIFTVYYKAPVPGTIRMSNSDDLPPLLPTHFNINTAHYIVGNSWNGCQTSVHEGFGLIWETIKSAF